MSKICCGKKAQTAYLQTGKKHLKNGQELTFTFQNMLR